MNIAKIIIFILDLKETISRKRKFFADRFSDRVTRVIFFSMNNINVRIIAYIRNSFNLSIAINMFHRQYYNFFREIYSKIIKINFVNCIIIALFKST